MSDFLRPPATIGVLGGGQLGRMLTMEARRMGYRVISWVGAPDNGPAGMADLVIEEPFDSPEALQTFLKEADVATVEFENIPRELLETVADAIPLMPGVKAITTCQHREREKRFLSENRFPCADFSVVDSTESLAEALTKLGDNGGILKTAEFGYDGKGQLSVTRDGDAEAIIRMNELPRLQELKDILESKNMIMLMNKKLT